MSSTICNMLTCAIPQHLSEEIKVLQEEIFKYLNIIILLLKMQVKINN